MATAQQILERILAEQRARTAAREGSVRSTAPYRDEPLIIRSSQMASYLPDRYREMRALARLPEARFKTEGWLFLQQARFMADWEDDVPYREPFQRYSPTYRVMTDRQLRSYFSWRSAVRRGTVEETSLSYAFLYLYELLCGIGSQNPEDGFRQIASFWKSYRAFAPDIDRYARRWTRDFAVYHNLGSDLLAQAVDLDPQRSIEVLDTAADRSDDELFQALVSRSSYRIEGSRLYRSRPATMQRAVCATYRALDAYFQAHRTLSLTDTLFGARVERPYVMFESAVFYAQDPPRDGTYELGGGDVFSCRNGYWAHRFHRHGSSKSARLGAIMKSVDACLREKTGEEPGLKQAGTAKYVLRIIERAVDGVLAWERAHTAPRIDIDLSRLASIRSAADATCEALLTDEERDGGVACAPAPPMPASAQPTTSQLATTAQVARNTIPDGKMQEAGAVAPPSRPEDATAPSQAAGGPCSAAQVAFVRALLDGGDAKAAAHEAGMPIDMLVDAVNEILYDVIGDTCIEFAGDGPTVIDVYEHDLRELLDL